MRQCKVSIIGADGEQHTANVEANGLFDAVEKAIRQWSPYW